MAFLFSSSHLPASRVRRPALEDDDHDENREAMPRSGGVRASSHLEGRMPEPETTRSAGGSPAPRSSGTGIDWMARLKELAEQQQQSRRADSAAPDSGPRRADEEHEPDAGAEHDDGAASGDVHDKAPEREEHDDTSSWYHPPESGSYHPDPGFNVRPEDIGHVSSDPGFNIRSEDIGTESPDTGFYQHLSEIKGDGKPAVQAGRAPSSSPDWSGRQSNGGRALPQGDQRSVGPDAAAGSSPVSGRTGVFPNSRLFEMRPHPALAKMIGAGSESAQRMLGGQARSGSRFRDDAKSVAGPRNGSPSSFAALSGAYEKNRQDASQSPTSQNSVQMQQMQAENSSTQGAAKPQDSGQPMKISPPLSTSPSGQMNTPDPDASPPTTGKVRFLTEGEKSLVRAIFGDTIKNLDKIEIHHHSYVPILTNPWTMAPNGNVYLGKHLRHIRDFSKVWYTDQAALIHEMTHVWQHQNGMNVVLRRLVKPLAAYNYTIEPGKPFHQYTMEQQASIVEDYFRSMHGETYTNKRAGKKGRIVYPAAVYRDLIPWLKHPPVPNSPPPP